MSENSDKYQLPFPKGQSDIFKCFVLSDQLSKDQRYSIYNDINHRKAEYTHNWN